MKFSFNEATFCLNQESKREIHLFLSEGTFLKVCVFAKNNCGDVHYILQGCIWLGVRTFNHYENLPQ